jgi:hypothetical protein
MIDPSFPRGKEALILGRFAWREHWGHGVSPMIHLIGHEGTIKFFFGEIFFPVGYAPEDPAATAGFAGGQDIELIFQTPVDAAPPLVRLGVPDFFAGMTHKVHCFLLHCVQMKGLAGTSLAYFWSIVYATRWLRLLSCKFSQL